MTASPETASLQTLAGLLDLSARTKPETVSLQTVADFLDIAPRTARALAQRGILARVKRDQYDLWQSVRGYCTYVGALADRDNGHGENCHGWDKLTYVLEVLRGRPSPEAVAALAGDLDRELAIRAQVMRGPA